MAQSDPSIPFKITPGQPTVVSVTDTDMKEWDTSLQVAVVAVRSSGKKDPVTGLPLFEFDLQVLMQTTPKGGT